MRLEYEWETSEIQDAFSAAGKTFLKQLYQNWKERDVDYLGITICDKIWPTLKGEVLPFAESAPAGDGTLVENTTMVFLPLDRMGQAQGKSNAKSALCYFRFESPDSPNTLYSLPIVIKQGQHEGGEKSLKNEFKQAEKISRYLRHSPVFVLPFYCYQDADRQIDFLLSTSVVDYDGRMVSITNGKISTFMDRLYGMEDTCDAKNMQEIQKMLGFIYGKLRYLHCGPSEVRGKKVTEPRTYAEEYGRYLRHMEEPARKGVFQRMWCADVVDYSMCKRSNCPLQLLEKILPLEWTFHTGGIHGDVHPRNIVFLGGLSSEAYLIDYGWAEEDAHVAKDFVLMECNLRFMALDPKISICARRAITGCIEREHIKEFLDKCVDGDTYVTGILSLIQEVRSQFQQTIQQLNEPPEQELSEETWLHEYYIPLFLTAYGLVKFYDECRNQTAMWETIDALATLLSEKIK